MVSGIMRSFYPLPAVPKPFLNMTPTPRKSPHAHALLGLVVVAITCWASPAAWAQTLKDPVLEALYVADKTDELKRAANQRLAAQPEDAQAVLALSLAALENNDNTQRAQALARAQACAERTPTAAACQYAYGVLLGIQAMSEGLMKAARSAGTVREALTAAHEADPAWYVARSALAEFYLAAPGFMGGSTTKAAELARTAPKREQSQALQARVAMVDKKFEAAAAGFLALPATLEHALAADVRGWASQTGLGMVNAGQAARAEPLFQRLIRERPQEAAGAYGLARVRGELGDWTEALRLFEHARNLKGAADLPLAYRMGIAQQQLGRMDAAKASYATFIEAGKGQKASLEDARKRLAQLGG